MLNGASSLLLALYILRESILCLETKLNWCPELTSLGFQGLFEARFKTCSSDMPLLLINKALPNC